MNETPTHAPGDLVHIGNGSVVWRIVRFANDGSALLKRVTRRIDGSGFDDTRYQPGLQMMKSVRADRLRAH